MDNYKKARLKLTLLYFGVIILIVIFFSVFAIQLNNAQYDRFDNSAQMEEMLKMRLRVVPPQYRDEFEKREREKNNQNLNSIKEAKNDFLFKLILMDLFLLFAAGLISVYLSYETLLPIVESYKRQKKFIADASHELRTPIAAMKSETDVILRSKKANEKDYKDTLISVNEELDILTRLSSYLLEIARSDDGNVIVNPENIDLSKLIEKDLKKFEKLISEKDIILTKEISENIKIFADPNRISQLLRILIDNSIKYNKPNGSIKVSLSSFENTALLEVSDTGIGIPKIEIEKIFDRFYRVTKDRNQKGFGLGLTIAKQIVEENSGNIKVESKENEWTKFLITFPLKQ